MRVSGSIGNKWSVIMDIIVKHVTALVNMLQLDNREDALAYIELLDADIKETVITVADKMMLSLMADLAVKFIKTRIKDINKEIDAARGGMEWVLNQEIKIKTIRGTECYSAANVFNDALKKVSENDN